MASTSSVMHEASAVLDQLLSEVKAKFASSQHQQGVFESIRAFTAAVDWTVRLHSSVIEAIHTVWPYS